MGNPFFFGYGSLVNRATHAYPNAAPAKATGWQRGWVDTLAHPYAYLTAIRSPGKSIEGLIAEVPGGDWAALDEREDAYDRIADTENVTHQHASAADIAIYAVPPTKTETQDPMPILLSYLDVVIQGYIQEFGSAGAERFLATTTGWQRPILNDRTAPIYPRAQILSGAEKTFVDSALRVLGSEVIAP
ncbi:MAG: gamma-glutamylcyclotransferase family protein [Paracoccaceae bacterium]